MKTNAGQSFDYRLLRDITGEEASHAPHSLVRNDRIQRGSPKQSVRWWTRLVSFLCAKSAALNTCLAEFYRLCNQAAPTEPGRTSVTITLRKGEVVNLTKRYRAKRIEVLNGIVWLTGEPARGDVLLQRGHRLELGSGAVHVMQSLGEATVTLETLNAAPNSGSL